MEQALFAPHVRWCDVVQGYVRKRKPDVLEKIDGVFSFIPADQKQGAWAWLPTITIGLLWVFVGATLPRAVSLLEPLPEAPALRWLRAIGCLYGVAVLAYMVKKIGAWPFASWTMLGWTLASVRYFAGALGFGQLQRVLLFPTLLANSATFVLWYAAILPGVMVMVPKHSRSIVVEKFVCSLFLFTVHGVNLPFSVADFAWQPVRLNEGDFWMGCVYSLLYLSFYHWVLDPLGAHLYFILTPRKWWGALVYIGILLLGAGCLSAYNRVFAQL